jgi:heparin binding hemagglutinin HbhA
MADSAPNASERRTNAVPPIDPTNPTNPTNDVHRNPWLAVLGASDAAVAAVASAVTHAFSAAVSRQKTVQQRVAELPTELDALRGRFSGEELHHALDTYRAQLERAYAGFSGRGEEAWGRLREHPQVRQAITALEAYTEKLDARVDDAHVAASRAFAAAGRQTRATGEKVAHVGQRFSGRAADTVVDASAVAAGAVEEVGTTAAEVIEQAGDETAAVTRKATGVDATTAPDTAPAARRAAAPRRSPRRTEGASE